MRALLAIVLLCSTAHADDRETCANGFVMRGPSDDEICADAAREQYWTNQGYRFVTNEQRGREIADRARESNAGRDWRAITTSILIGLLVAAFVAWLLWKRRR